MLATYVGAELVNSSSAGADLPDNLIYIYVARTAGVKIVQSSAGWHM